MNETLMPDRINNKDMMSSHLFLFGAWHCTQGNILICVNRTPETMSVPRQTAKITVKFSAGVSVWLTTSIHPTISTTIAFLVLVCALACVFMC